MIDKNQLFKNYPYVLEALGVTFLQTNCSAVDMKRGNNYFAGKHKLHGYKGKFLLLTNGYATDIS